MKSHPVTQPNPQSRRKRSMNVHGRAWEQGKRRHERGREWLYLTSKTSLLQFEWWEQVTVPLESCALQRLEAT